jgi:hypothetical protein
MAINVFRSLASEYPKGHCVGEGPYIIRVSDKGVSMVVSYRVKTDGVWSEVNTYNVAL